MDTMVYYLLDTQPQKKHKKYDERITPTKLDYYEDQILKMKRSRKNKPVNLLELNGSN
jgi:hypothetical protein